MGYLAIDEQSKRTGFHMLKTCKLLFSVSNTLDSCDGRVVKAFDSKSNGIFPRRFESYSQRWPFCNFDFIGRYKTECIVGESNPGLPRGRREFYHWTNNACCLEGINFEYMDLDSEKILHCRGIEPRSPAWQARILPLNQQCKCYALVCNVYKLFFTYVLSRATNIT